MLFWRNKTADEFIGILIFVFLLSIAAAGTRAALVSGVSDTMSRLATSVAANHALSFISPSGIAEGQTITVTFPVSWSAVGLTADDIDLSDNGVELTTAPDCSGSAEAAAAWAGNTLSLLICAGDGGAIAPGHTVGILIGTNAVNSGLGLHRVINPPTPGAYRLVIGGSFADSGTAPIAITSADEVGVEACVGADCPTISNGHAPSGGMPIPSQPPEVDNILVDQISASTARISWHTNQEANSFVLFGTTLPLVGVSGNDALSLEHVMTLSGLAPGQTYKYKIRSVNIFGDIGWSSTLSFTTLPAQSVVKPQIFNITLNSVGGYAAEIGWQTDIPAYWQLEYGRTANYSSMVLDTTPDLSQRAELDNLFPATTYHYRITAIAANGLRSVTPDLTFTTFDTTAPNIFDIKVQNSGLHSFDLSWSTNKLTVGSVKYGTSLSYASGEAIESVSFVTNHHVSLIGLSPGTTYHFEIYATDQFGNDGKSGDQSAQTLVLSIPPNVTGLTAVPANQRISLSWENPDVAGFAKVIVRRRQNDYPATILDGTLVYEGAGSTATDRNLTNGKAYYYTVWALNETGQASSGAITAARPVAEAVIPFVESSTGASGGQPSVPIYAVPLDGSKKSMAVGSSQLVIFVQGVPVPIIADQIVALAAKQISLNLPAGLTTKPIDRAYVRIGNDVYAMQANATNDYGTVNTAPPNAGEYASALLIEYADKTSAYAKWNFHIADAGHIFALEANGRVPLGGATVTLFDEQGNAWDGAKYGQPNPTTTSADGRYSFYVPQGRYSLRIEKPGYASYAVPEQLYKGPVNIDFQLTKALTPGSVPAKVVNDDNLAKIKQISVCGFPWILVIIMVLYMIRRLIKRKKSTN